MTIERLKRIEIITTIVITVLLVPYALAVGWFVGDHYTVQIWFEKNLGWKYFLHLTYGVLAFAFAPIILFIIRKVTQKNTAVISVFFATLPFMVVLFGVPAIYFPLFIILVWRGIAAQQTAQQLGLKWPLAFHMLLSIVLGAIFSFIVSWLVRAYVTYRYRVATSKEGSRIR